MTREVRLVTFDRRRKIICRQTFAVVAFHRAPGISLRILNRSQSRPVKFQPHSRALQQNGAPRASALDKAAAEGVFALAEQQPARNFTMASCYLYPLSCPILLRRWRRQVRRVSKAASE